MDGNQGAAVLRDECNKDSVEEMRRRLEEAERRNVELETSLNQAVARSQQMLRIPLNRQAYRRELLSKFIAFVENRLRFLEALQRVCDECKSARKQTNLATIGVGTVGILASLQRHAQMAGSVISLMAVALNTFLAVKGNFNEATRIRQLEKLEETDLKLIGQLLSAYDEFCTLFEVEKRVGNEDVMRLHISEVVSWIVTFVEGIGTARLIAMTGVTNIRDVVNYGCFNAIFPVLGSIGSSKLPDSFGSLLNMAAAPTVPQLTGEQTSTSKYLACVINGFCVLNAVGDLMNGSE
uniref:Goodbye domain-containing protein n=1 Tax=Ascaris lumbricoides TaxID=6252 RepID=A0A0M3HXS7_ASCLU